MITTMHREMLWDVRPTEERGIYRVSRFDSEEDCFAADYGRSGGSSYEVQLGELLADQPNRPARRRFAQTATEAEFVGRSLFQRLPPQLTAPLTDAGGPPLRLKVCSEDPSVNDLPWEWLSDGAKPPLAVRDDVRFCRAVPMQVPPPALTIDFPLRILVVVTNPKDERLLHSWREIDALVGGLAQGREHRSEVLDRPTLDALRGKLESFQPHVVHYVGHAGIAQGQGHVILHDDDGRSCWISAAAISAALPVSTRLLCLSTCFTVPNYQLLGLPRIAQVPSSVPLPTAVSNQYAVGEDGATVRAFWTAFYAGLVQRGRDVIEAVHDARKTVYREWPASADWASFRLTVRDRTGRPFRVQPQRPAGDEVIEVTETMTQTATEAASRRRGGELRAHLAAALANDLAEQVRAFGPSASNILRRHSEVQQRRAARFVDELSSEPEGE